MHLQRATVLRGSDRVLVRFQTSRCAAVYGAPKLQCPGAGSNGLSLEICPWPGLLAIAEVEHRGCSNEGLPPRLARTVRNDGCTSPGRGTGRLPRTFTASDSR